MDGWMHAPSWRRMPARNQRNLLARLVIVYFAAIGVSENHTLSSRNVETPTNTLRAPWAHLSVPAMTSIRKPLTPETRGQRSCKEIVRSMS